MKIAKRRACFSRQIPGDLLAKGGFRRLLVHALVAGSSLAFDVPHPDKRQKDGDHRYRGGDGDQPRARERIECLTRSGRGCDKTRDYHGPCDRGGGAAPGRIGALCKQDQQRGARGGDADADHDEGNRGERNAERELRRHQGRRNCRKRTACGVQHHAADDPGRAAAADVGAIAEPRAKQLHRVMKADQKPGQHRGQRQFHHHDAVERRHGQDRHRAERGLHQAETDDLQPGQWRRRVRHHARRPAIIRAPRLEITGRHDAMHRRTKAMRGRGVLRPPNPTIGG